MFQALAAAVDSDIGDEMPCPCPCPCPAAVEKQPQRYKTSSLVRWHQTGNVGSLSRNALWICVETARPTFLSFCTPVFKCRTCGIMP